jgi:serine/threonine protein kinase
MPLEIRFPRPITAPVTAKMTAPRLDSQIAYRYDPDMHARAKPEGEAELDALTTPTHADVAPPHPSLLEAVVTDKEPSALPDLSDEDSWTAGVTLRPGHLIDGRYRVVRKLGSGGMGQVVEALHLELDRVVAVKVLHTAWAKDEDSAKRFVREARVVATLTNEHVVRIFDLGRTPDGAPYIVMERLDGKDLGALLADETPIAVHDAVEWIAQASEALAEAHDHGIVHRDVKPQNLFLANVNGGRPAIKVLDFGLAKNLTANASAVDPSKLTGVHMLLGSPHFMSPEQIRDARMVDARTDVWSLGATLFQLLCRQPPFVAENLHMLCAAILNSPIPSIRARKPELPVALDSIVTRCLSRSSDQRYPSARALAEDLRRLTLPSSGAFVARTLDPLKVTVPLAPPVIHRAGRGPTAPVPTKPSAGVEMPPPSRLPVTVASPAVQIVDAPFSSLEAPAPSRRGGRSRTFILCTVGAVSLIAGVAAGAFRSRTMANSEPAATISTPTESAPPAPTPSASVEVAAPSSVPPSPAVSNEPAATNGKPVAKRPSGPATSPTPSTRRPAPTPSFDPLAHP